MIRGVGVDIIEIERIRAAMERRPGLRKRLFSPSEIDYCQGKPASEFSHFAGRFAAKEAVAKALGRSLSWQEVIVEREATGRPVVRLDGRAAEAARGGCIMLTISHSRDYAVAYAVFTGQESAPANEPLEGRQP
jgi:holo-[acyl-carrier protein] synthase